MFSSGGASVSPRKESQSFYFDHNCQSPTSSFPYLNVSELTPEQKERLKIRLCVESEDIVRKFAHLRSRVYESLCVQNISVSKLVTHLLSLGALDPVSKECQKPLFLTYSQELRNAGSIEDVLWVIGDYFSFFNYHVIEHIVIELGTDQDRVELEKYKNEFDEYSKRRIYECPRDYGPMSKTDHANLVMKLDSEYENFTVKELKKLECRLSRIFCVSPQSVLRLCQVDKGCIQLIFQVPSFIQQEIFPLSSEQEMSLAVEGVTKLTCGSYQFVAEVSKILPTINSLVQYVNTSEENMFLMWPHMAVLVYFMPSKPQNVCLYISGGMWYHFIWKCYYECDVLPYIGKCR